MSTMASQIASSASSLFTQPFIQEQIKENFKDPRHWPLCGHRSPVTGEFPAQMASKAENVSISWRRRDMYQPYLLFLNLTQFTLIFIPSNWLDIPELLKYQHETFV